MWPSRPASRRKIDARSLEQLARWLGLPVSALPQIRLGREYYYRPLKVPKGNGQLRQVYAPSPALKTLQQRLLKSYLITLPIHPAAQAFYPKASIVRNAHRHAGQTTLVTADIIDFFGTTSADRVRDFFLAQGWRDEALTVLMRLCVWRNGLPQGAPTSPCLSNLVNVPLDETLHHLARQAQARYTRYGDDLAFSWASAAPPPEFELAVREQLLQAGYQLPSAGSAKGWRVAPITTSPLLTGLHLRPNGQLRPPLAQLWRVWVLSWQHWWSPTYAQAQRLNGYRGFWRMLKGR